MSTKFADDLKQKREFIDMSRNELSQKSGISIQQLSQYESGKRLPDLRSFVKLVRAMPYKVESYIKYIKYEC